MKVARFYWGLCAVSLLGILLLPQNVHAGPHTLHRAYPPLEDGADFPIVQGAADLLRPALADGRLLIWYSYGEDGTDIFGLHLDPHGHALDEPFIIAAGPGDQSVPAIALNTASGGYLVVWHSQPGAAAEFDVYARYLSHDGHPLGDPIAVSTAAGDQLRPDVAYLPQTDRFVIVWQDGREMAKNGFDVYARTAPGDGLSGGAWGPEWTVSSAAHNQMIPAIACESQGPRCLTAWMDDRRGRSYHTDIMARLVDAAAGRSLGNRINVAVEPRQQDSPTVIYNPVSAEYLVVWNDDISCRRVSRNGRLIGSRISVSRESPFQYKPAVALDDAGHYLIVWEDGRNQADRGMDIYGQRLSPTGALLGANFALSTNPRHQYWPAITFEPTTHLFLAVWEDDRDENGLALYGQLLPPSTEDR